MTVGEFLERAPAARHAAAPLRRELDQPQLRHLDRPRRGQPRLGRAARHPRSSWSPRRRTGRHDPEALRRAWDEIYIAEGTDWFWWYGDDHSSAQDALFDHLFRKHLRNVYTLLGHEPARLALHPDLAGGPHRPIHDQPNSFLRVKIDGRSSYFEWINAARYVCGNERGTMTLVAKGVLQCDLVRLQHRAAADPVDTEGGPARERLAEVGPAPDRLRRPGRVGDPGAGARRCPGPSAYIHHAGEPSSNGDDRRGRHRTRSSSWPSRSAGSA